MNKLQPATIRRFPSGARGGFTLLELLIVLMIAAILMSYAVPGFTRLMNSRNAQNARDAVVWLANRARTRAVARGQMQLLEINPARNAAWVVRRGATTAADTAEIIYFSNEHGATVSTSTGNTIRLCFSPRGYAVTCTGGVTATDTVTLTHAGRTARAAVKVLGQVERI